MTYIMATRNTKAYQLRCTQEEFAAWRSAAFKAEMPVSEWMRETLNGRVELVAAAVNAQLGAPLVKPAREFKAPRKAMCEHRVPAGAYCARCDA